jgi:hypothetical protein
MHQVVALLLAVALPSYALVPCLGSCNIVPSTGYSQNMWCGEPVSELFELADIVPDPTKDDPANRPCHSLVAPLGRGDGFRSVLLFEKQGCSVRFPAELRIKLIPPSYADHSLFNEELRRS